ncbi:thiol-disulfide oxidoreductase ResA [Aciduricibacillus chroicocephali]|uniref:Thiol-disulfide oxidoreductase ResA n=1 Tax=Aciduricibacillus chroicocephali TaxID=3054939 RepID=A0ABY9KRY8_9BACI|nr:thiol-disulfide oxidoreductase ResA [Bacillaceae bacterium 44XB]
MSLEDRINSKKGKKRKRLLFRSAILVVLVGATTFALISNFTRDKETYAEGDKAPDFKLSQLNKANPEDAVQLSKLKEKGIMLNFWATYCPPCEREMPYIQSMYDKYKDQGIAIVSVNLDSTELVVQNFIDKYDLTFPVLRDKDMTVRDLYGIKPIPSSIFINPEGKIVRKVNGELDEDSLESYLKEIQSGQGGN